MAPAQYKNENRVKNNIDRRAGQRGYHSEFGVPVRTDNWIHGLAEHIKRDAEADVKEIFLGMAERFCVDGSAEHSNDGIGEYKVDCREDQTGGKDHHNRVSHALFRPVAFILAKADADIGAAAVTNHDRNGKSHNGKRKENRVRRIAVGAEIIRIGDKNLVNDVVECADKKRDHTGNRIFAHQRTDAFRSQKLI